MNISFFILGEHCETDIDECADHPCQNTATCDDYLGYYICTCVPGYTGRYPVKKKLHI